MPASAVIAIEQIEGLSSLAGVRDLTVVNSNSVLVYQDTFAISSSTLQGHLSPTMNPVSAPSRQGWETSNPDNWSDSPGNQPDLLYRYRFSYGRDRRELFNNGFGSLGPGDPGARWGKLDNNNGQLLYEKLFPLSATGQVRTFKVETESTLRELSTQISSTKNVAHLGPVSGDADLEIFPFNVFAFPVPFSEKNPRDTDVFIRLSNFSFPIDPDTITLSLDGIIEVPLNIEPFFGGLGGFDVTWENTHLFDWDARVDVVWEFLDTDVPPNRVQIKYPFYILSDLAPPRAINFVPADGAENVPILGPIQFELIDFESDVDISSLVLYVNGVKVLNGVNGELTITAPRFAGNPYIVNFAPFDAWLYSDLIAVAIFVKDTSANKNELFHSYAFTTQESTPPRLLNINPLPCSTNISVMTEIKVDVVDGGHGLDRDSVLMTVEDIERGNKLLIIPIVHRDE